LLAFRKSNIHPILHRYIYFQTSKLVLDSTKLISILSLYPSESSLRKVGRQVDRKETCMRFAVAIFLLIGTATAQRRVDPRQLHQRVICVVPMIGAGTAADPRRPQYSPWPLPKRTPGTAPTASKGIIASSYQISDDKKFALVEFVARDRSAFQAILADKSIKVFEMGKHKAIDIGNELKKYKKDFDLNKFGTVVP
jgi:hypothetical protein